MQKLKIKFGKSINPTQQKIGVGLAVVAALVLIGGAGYMYYFGSTPAAQEAVQADLGVAPPVNQGGQTQAVQPEQAASAMVQSGQVPASSGQAIPAGPGNTGPLGQGAMQGSAQAGAGSAPTAPVGGAMVPQSNMQLAIASATAAVSGSGPNSKQVAPPLIAGQPDQVTFGAIGQMVRLEVERSAALSKAEALKMKAEVAKFEAETAITKPAEVKPKEKVKKINIEIPPEPVNNDVVEILSVVGKPGRERAEVSINGVVVTTASQVNVGTYFVNSIDANCIYMTDRLNKKVNRCILR